MQSISSALVCLIAIGMLVDPSRPLPFDLCLWQRLFDLSCPTCGLTRAVCSALQLELAASWRYHPAGVFVAAGLVAYSFSASVGGSRTARIAGMKEAASAVATAIAAIATRVAGSVGRTL